MLSTDALPYFAVVCRRDGRADGPEDRHGEDPAGVTWHTLRVTVGAIRQEPSGERSRIGHLERPAAASRGMRPLPCRRVTLMRPSAACAHHIARTRSAARGRTEPSRTLLPSLPS